MSGAGPDRARVTDVLGQSLHHDRYLRWVERPPMRICLVAEADGISVTYGDSESAKWVPPIYFRLLSAGGRLNHSADRRRGPTIRSLNQQRVWRLYSRPRK